jgi:hypothetical protein
MDRYDELLARQLALAHKKKEDLTTDDEKLAQVIADEEYAKIIDKYMLIENDYIVETYINKNDERMKDKYIVEQELLKGADVINVPGDSNCLVYAVLTCLYLHKSFNDFTNMIIMLHTDSGSDIEIPESIFVFDNNIARYFEKNEVFFSLFSQHVIRKIMRDKWAFVSSNFAYEQNPDNHMNEVAIDSLGRNMICKIFSISELHVIQAFDGHDRKRGKTIIKPNTDLERFQQLFPYLYDFEPIQVDIFTVDSTHYYGIIN